MTLSPGTRLGAYEIVTPLGAGGMGEVYRAKDTKLGRDVALKILPATFTNDPERLARFRREAQVLASLNHPHIGAIYGLEESSGQQFLVLELADGESLDKRITRGKIPVDGALAIAKQIAEALEAAHEKGIVHRDLKPANIALTTEGTVKVLDFGLAKATEPASSPSIDVTASPTITLAMMSGVGVIFGTAAYMSPEQAAGNPVDKRSDLWAFGVVLLEMLTGRPVFSGETVSHVLAAVLKSDPDWTTLPATTPAPLQRLLRRCLQKDRKRRLDSAADARLEIEDALTSSSADTSSGTTAVSRVFLLPGLALTTLIATAVAVVTVPAAYRASREIAHSNPPIWMEIRPLEGNTFGGARGAPQSAASPDGRSLTYTALAPDGVRHLWLQRFDQPSPQRIAGTDGASVPFWAPDGRWIGFAAAGKLRKVDTTTWTVQALCDAPAFDGGTWNANGDIVFSAGRPRQLQRIHAAGGTPTRITSLSGVVETVPQFLPDARHVLFHTQGTGVWVADLEGTQPPKKIRDSETPAVYGNGHLLFRQGTLLLAQAFDVRRFELTGDPIAVAKEVGEDPSYSVSPAGVLIFRPPVRTELTQLTWFTRQGQQERTVGARGAYQTLSLSPDGGRVAVEATDPRSGETSIWLIDAARSITERFTFTHGPDEFPVWSGDGSRIVFSSHRANRVGIFEKAATGGAERTLAVDASHSLDWSADGRYVLYLADEGGPTELLVALSTKGGDKPIPVVSDPGIRQAQFSPDGRWVTYSSDRSGRLEVYVTDFPAGKARWQISSAGGDQPRWPSRANEIVYLAPDGKLMSVPVKSGAAFEAGTPVPLFEVRTVPPSNRRHQYAVSANGQRFLVSALVGELGSQSTMTVVLNWPALLKK